MLFVTGWARAEEPPPTIVLVTSQRHLALERRLRAELLSLEFRVEEVEGTDGEISLENLSREREAIGALRVTTAGEAVEIWVLSRGAEQAKSREFVPVSARRGVDVNAIAAVEVLRARMIKLGLTQERPELAPPPAAPKPPPLEARPLPELAPKVFWAALGAGATYSPGGLETNPVLLGGIRVAPASWISTAVFVAWQPMSRTVLEAEGQAQVRASLVGVGLDFPSRARRLEAAFGAGAALVFVEMQGHATPPFAGADDSVFAPAPVFRSSLVWRGSELLGLRGDLMLGVSTPRVAIRFGGRETQHWGRPFGVLALGVELGLF